MGHELLLQYVCMQTHKIKLPYLLHVLATCSSTPALNICCSGSTGTYPSRLCTSNTNTHPLTPEDLKEFVFVERISFALQAPATLSPSESFFVFQYLKRHKGKHRQFICLFVPSQRLFKSQSCSFSYHMELWLTKSAFSVHVNVFDLIARSAPPKESSAKCRAPPDWGKKVSPPTSPWNKVKLF